MKELLPFSFLPVVVAIRAFELFRMMRRQPMRKPYCRRRLVQGILTGAFAYTRQQPKVQSSQKEKRPTTVSETRVGSVLDLTRQTWFDGQVLAETSNNSAKAVMPPGCADSIQRRATYVYDRGCWRDASTGHTEPGNRGTTAELSQCPADALQRRTTYMYDSAAWRDPSTGRSVELGQARSITTYTFDTNGNLLSIKEWPKGDRDRGIASQSK
jgi:hypothetical protein